MASFNLDTLTVSARLMAAGDYAGIYGRGQIAANGASAIETFGAVMIRNDGVIASFSHAAIKASAPGLVLENSGIVTGAAEAIDAAFNGATSMPRIVNSGEIRASTGSFAAIRIAGYGADIVNTGTITSLGGIALHFSAVNGGSTENRVYNDGLIYGGSTARQALSGSDAAERIENIGTISGRIDTNAGADVVLNAGVVTGAISLGSGDDTYDGRGGSTYGRIDGNDGADLLRAGREGDWMTGGNGADSLIGSVGNDTLEGGNDNDQLIGAAGDDSLAGGIGVDTLRGGAGDDFLDGGDWGDRITGGSGDDEILGGTGLDNILGGAGDDTIDGGSENDSIKAGNGDDVVQGGAGQDTIHGAGGDDDLDGGTESDLILGGSGNDTLLGGSGADTLDGGADADLLTGGAGPDVFVFGIGSGRDIVTDFQNGVDRIDLTDWAVPNYAGLQAIATIRGTVNRVRIDFHDGDILVLPAVTVSQLDYYDFVF